MLDEYAVMFANYESTNVHDVIVKGASDINKGDDAIISIIGESNSCSNKQEEIQELHLLMPFKQTHTNQDQSQKGKQREAWKWRITQIQMKMGIVGSKSS